MYTTIKESYFSNSFHKTMHIWWLIVNQTKTSTKTGIKIKLLYNYYI